MARELRLSCGRVAIVDDDDYERCSMFKWFRLKKDCKRGHELNEINARTTNGRKQCRVCDREKKKMAWEATRRRLDEMERRLSEKNQTLDCTKT